MITIEPSAQTVSSSENYFAVEVVYMDIDDYDDILAPDCPAWIETEEDDIDWDGDNCRVTYNVHVHENNGAARSYDVKFSCIRGGLVDYNTILVSQENGLTRYLPIWKDTIYYAQSFSVFAYSIDCDDEKIFFGKDWCAPGDGGVRINVNQVCQSYLKNNLTFANGVTLNEGAWRKFKLYDEDGNTLYSYYYLLAWDGDGDEGIISRPVNGHLDPRMKMTVTYFSKNNIDVNYTLE